MPLLHLLSLCLPCFTSLCCWLSINILPVESYQIKIISWFFFFLLLPSHFSLLCVLFFSELVFFHLLLFKFHAYISFLAFFFFNLFLVVFLKPSLHLISTFFFFLHCFSALLYTDCFALWLMSLWQILSWCLSPLPALPPAWELP